MNELKIGLAAQTPESTVVAEWTPLPRGDRSDWARQQSTRD